MKFKFAAILALLPLMMSPQDFIPTTFSIVHVADAEAIMPEMPVIASLNLELSTDKACYAPGETVRFSASGMPAGAIVRYRHGADVIEETSVGRIQWEWVAPQTDFMGYLVDVYKPAADGKEDILGTIAVDVSSDWVKFPRYGFVATFDNSKLPDGVIEGEMAYLNRCHINGVQFQDWHNKHHWPLGGTRDHLDEVYKDIANRDIYTSVVKKYIDVQHGYGMKSIFYNLCFGALDDAAADGVSDAWFIFRDSHRGERDYHGLPAGWKSNIYLVNPGNPQWIDYIGQRNDDVYHNLDFDGYQIDQLGWRGTRFDYDGRVVDLPEQYAVFINAMKELHPSKRLIMNAVSSFGADKIVGTGKVDFAYNETWNDEPYFSNLRDIIAANDRFSRDNGGIRTIFASYMNYDKAGREEGWMNTPGVILTDAVMMALGGDHLELGDHMLSREYFPASPLKMDDELRQAMIRYYDFMTAYENLLRENTTADEIRPDIKYAGSTRGVNLCAWPPQAGYITTYCRNAGDKMVCHLLNFSNAGDLRWCDTDGTRQAPREFASVPLRVEAGRQVSKVWMASPDYFGGVAVELPFETDGVELTFTVPAINYWTMIVME